MSAPSPALSTHGVIRRWFADRYGKPTEAQAAAWPAIAAGRDTLVAAPTGSGKTFAAFLHAIDRLLRLATAGELEDQCKVLYISPLKALSHDIKRNLDTPLAEILAAAEQEGLPTAKIRAAVRTGDTTPSQRQAMLRKPPHILVTTPESLFLLLTSERGQQMLADVETVIVDEIHALARDKRGSHLALSLARLDHLCTQPPLRIGLSATQRPMDKIAAFLVGSEDRPCQIIDGGHLRDLDLAVEVPDTDLSAVCSNEQWQEIYLRLTQLIRDHRATLIFVNTRKLAERIAFHLSDRLGDEAVACHHGSLSKERRHQAEERLKRGELKAVVATASLELGIDIGYIDLVCQIGSPRAIATFLQRVGRSGHAVKATPKGRLFALTREELIEVLALIRAVHAGDLDTLEIPDAPLDILAQQIVAMCALREWDEDELYRIIRNTYPYRHLTRDTFDQVVEMLHVGYSPRRHKRSYLHRDAIKRRLRGKRGAKIAAATSGGAIPDQADYRVVLDGEGTYIGSVNEDFAIESSAGDIFLLGNTSWQIVHVRATTVTVRDAEGAPPTIPFWLGEAPGRSFELSGAVGKLREEITAHLPAQIDPHDPLMRIETADALLSIDPPAYQQALRWLKEQTGSPAFALVQAIHYVAVQKSAVGVVPTQNSIVFERFFDDTGGMQLVIHAPFGMRVNRGLGLALRKRFCRSFDFELQASADDNGIVLSIGPHQSFPIESIYKMVNADNVQELLEQALLQVPFFQVRWRWNASRALAVLRQNGGSRVPPALQRFRSDDLLTQVFPAQTQCFEHITGDIDLPDHPLVNQTMIDCLFEAIDLKRLQRVLRQIDHKAIELFARETREPSPFAYELLNANPYAFLDDAPLEERRARAIATRRGLAHDVLQDLGALDPQAIEQVRNEAWPLVRDADELYEALAVVGLLPESLVRQHSDERLPAPLATGETQPSARSAWQQEFAQLCAEGRACRAVNRNSGEAYWLAAENIPLVRAAIPEDQLQLTDPPPLPEHLAKEWDSAEARTAIVRGITELCPVITAEQIATLTGLARSNIQTSLEAIESRGDILRGHYSPPSRTANQEEWCDRRYLVRIHRLTLAGLRRQIRPVSTPNFLSFLMQHQGLTCAAARYGIMGLRQTIEQLQGFEASAKSWEADILPRRLDGYRNENLDELCYRGEVCWGRLRVNTEGEGRMTRATPLTLFQRTDMPWLIPYNPDAEKQHEQLSEIAMSVLTIIKKFGAQFLDEIQMRSRLLPAQIDDALGELIRMGLIHADGFASIRSLGQPRKSFAVTKFRGLKKACAESSGRWALFPPAGLPEIDQETKVLAWAWQLLQRYGVMFRDLLRRENAAPSWRELARCYRQLEARGEIRGGRFVAGVSGEQFGLPAAIDQLREIRERGSTGEWVIISASDPLNLTGSLIEGPTIPISRNGRLAIQDGQLIAAEEPDGEIVFFDGYQEGAAPRLELSTRSDIERAIRQSGRVHSAQRSLHSEAFGDENQPAPEPL